MHVDVLSGYFICGAGSLVGAAMLRIAEKAGWKSVEAIQRARANIQRRLDPDVDDISLN